MSHHAPSPRRSGAFAAKAGAVGCACVAFATFTPSVAFAELPGRVDLKWSREAPGCIDRDDLATAVEATLGAPVFHGVGPVAGLVEGRVGAAAKGGFEAQMILRDLDGVVVSERRIDTDGDCRRLDEPIAVVVALMIDAIGPAPRPLSIPSQPLRPAPPSPTPPPPPRAPREPTSPPRDSSTKLSLGAGLGLASSLLPGTSLAAVLRGEVAPIEALPLAWTLHFHGSSSVEADGVGGRFWAWTATMGACPGWSWDRERLGLCASLGVGSISATGIGFPDRLDARRGLYFAGLAPYAALRLAGPVWLRAELGVDVPFRRDRWGYLDAAGAYTVVHRTAAVVPSGALTLEFRGGQ
jgi:hypothetical protein